MATSLNFGALRTQVRVKLVESSEGFFEDSDIDTWINQAQLDIARETELLQGIFTGNITASDETYTLPDDCFSVIKAYYLLNGQYRELENYSEDEYFSKNTLVSTPTHYLVWQDSLYLYPTPASAVTNGYRIRYCVMPSELTDTSDMPFLGYKRFYPYHKVIVLYAAARGKEKEGETQEALLLEQQYQAGLMKIKREVNGTQKGKIYAAKPHGGGSRKFVRLPEHY